MAYPSPCGLLRFIIWSRSDFFGIFSRGEMLGRWWILCSPRRPFPICFEQVCLIENKLWLRTSIRRRRRKRHYSIERFNICTVHGKSRPDHLISLLVVKSCQSWHENRIIIMPFSLNWYWCRCRLERRSELSSFISPLASIAQLKAICNSTRFI